MPCSAGCVAAPAVTGELSGGCCASAAVSNGGAANRISAARMDCINDIGLERCVSGTPSPRFRFNVSGESAEKLPHRENFHKGFLRVIFGIAFVNAFLERF